MSDTYAIIYHTAVAYLTESIIELSRECLHLTVYLSSSGKRELGMEAFSFYLNVDLDELLNQSFVFHLWSIRLVIAFWQGIGGF